MDQDPDIDRDGSGGRDTTRSPSQSQSQAQFQSHPQSRQIDLLNGSRYHLDNDHHPDFHSSRHQHHDSHDSHDPRNPHSSRSSHDYYEHHDYRDSPHSSPLNLDPSPSSPSSYKRFPVAVNLNAASANAHHAVDAPPIVPDDFYKSYRVLSPDESPDSLPMATSSVSRPHLRSNGDGTTPRHPAVPSSRGQPRPNANSRSVSSPLDRTPASSAARPSPNSNLSVKDLKKRFDQNGAASPPVPRVPVRSRAAVRTKPDLSTMNEHQKTSTPYSNLRSGIQQGSTIKTPNTVSSRSQRPKFVAQDQVSSNAQSFASRIGKPRTSASGTSISSKSATNLAHKPARTPQAPPSPPPSVPRSHGLLFGEILPEQRDTEAAGHGIAGVRPRRTSESHLQDTFGGRPRSFSDVDAEPSSPTSWYRSAHTTGASPQDTVSHRPKYHLRSQSDATTSLSTPHNIRKSTANPSPSSTSNQSLPTSRLPRAVSKINSPSASGSSSPPSTRSNSPTLKRPQANGRRSRASTASSRAKTPTSRAKTPTQSATGRKPPPPSLATSTSNTRLQAYIANPPPKLSPPLRSSRPRQPISMASKPGSRPKESDRSNSRLSTKENESTPRRRKLSIGPIDFEKRREHIRLAYSKSVKENEAVEARRRAAERRRAQMESAAKMKDADSASLANSASASPTTLDVRRPDHDAVRDSGGVLQAKDSNETVTPSTAQGFAEAYPDTSRQTTHSLTISTAMASGLGLIQPSGTKLDSPTLGVPGSFPSLSPPADKDDEPQSATSATTEFDIEPQTTPPAQALSPADIPITVVKPPSPDTSARPRSEYQYPFHDEPDTPEQESTSQDTVYGSQKTISAPILREEPSIPGAFKDDYDEVEDFAATHHSAYETTVTIFPPPQDERSYEGDTRETVPFPRMNLYDDSQSESEHLQNNGQHDEDAGTDSCTEATDDPGRDEDQYSRFNNQALSQRASTCASTDIEYQDDVHLSGFHHHTNADTTSIGLRVPGSASANDRLSVQSAWTDFSVDSPDPSDESKSPAMPCGESPSFGHATIFESRPFPRDSDGSFRETHYRNSGVTNESERSSAQYNRPRLPEVDTGDGFSIPYLSPGASTSLSYLPSPTHEPPPVPSSVSGSAFNSRTSSVYYDNSQYGSTLVTSGGGSEDHLSHMETPLSMDGTSTADQYFGTQPPADSDAKPLAQDMDGSTAKEIHRLAQRRNVIKELVDTEAVFVRDMNIVEEIYKGTAEACPKLDDQTVKLIFRNSHEIIVLHTQFLAQIKEAVASVYVPKGGRSPKSNEVSMLSEMSQSGTGDANDAKDRTSSLGPVFQNNMEKMKLVHEGFLRNSDHAAKKLIQIQQDSTVKVWLNECNEVAKDLTAAWDLDSLLIKPMQRITKYPNLIMTLLQHTPQDHPDRESLLSAKDTLEVAIIEINKTKKNFELVGQIVGRKRKESDVKAGFARAFGKRVDKLQAPNNRPPEDPIYAKLNEKFGDDYLRLQVVLRDVEFYTRQVAAYVHEFLQYMSSIELVMRLQPGNYPELESKWVQFNISVRDLEKVALEEHLSQVRKQVIEPFELVIKAYGNPSLAMKKRQKRRVDYERSEQLKRAGKSIDPKLKEFVEQYEALNDTLKMELPKLSSMTEKVGNICLANFVNIQANWYSIWKDKMKTLLGDCPDMPDLKEIVSTFHRDHPYAVDQLSTIAILDPTYRGRASQSTTTSGDDGLRKARSRPSDVESRGRQSTATETVPNLPAPEFTMLNSMPLAAPSPSGSGAGSATGHGTVPNPHHYYYRDYYSGIQANSMNSPSTRSPEMSGSGSRSVAGTGPASTRPSTGRSFDSGALPRQSSESATQYQRDSNTTYNSNYPVQDGPRYSNLFHSALPLPDGPEESHRSSRASSHERTRLSDSFNVLWLAASLFEFNITTTKHEAGYPYLTYQAGEIFDVIAEKGELWLAKNQDDPSDQIGWIWSKHFAKLADA